ncbi:PadR family transcriptional regulator [bacterium]|nr:MAG: PadR family transcriptional regulator [bacterium]
MLLRLFMEHYVVKGDVPVLVMAILSEAPCHGYAIAREIERRSGQRFKMKEGTLYPALRVLEQNGWVEGQWEVQPSGPARKVYRLSSAGHAELQRRASLWQGYTQAFYAVLKPQGGADEQLA